MVKHLRIFLAARFDRAIDQTESNVINFFEVTKYYAPYYEIMFFHMPLQKNRPV